MAIELISKIKPKNNGTFPMVDAEDVEMPDGTRLSDFKGGVTSVNGQTGDVTIAVDDALSDTSTNPVQNKVITELFNEASEVINQLGGAVSTLQTGITVLGEKTLPTVTTADNDKILQVVDGAWSAVAMTDVSEVGM